MYKELLCLWELNVIRLRGFFLESTIPDLGNASGGNFLFDIPSPHFVRVLFWRTTMNKSSNTIKTICEVGIFAALGYVLDELQGIISKGLFINGGSIGFAMIAVLIIAYRRGWLPAILTGLIMGGLDIATSAYILHPAQLLLDYILPYAVVGLAGIFKFIFDKVKTKRQKIFWICIGTLVGGLAKLLSHYLAGIIFWADPENFAWGLQNMNPYLYCFIYNFSFIGPSIILTGALLIVLYLRAPRILTNRLDIIKSEKKRSKDEVVPAINSAIYLVLGITTFTIFLIKYIMSYESYQDGAAFGYDFDQDSMVIFVCGFAFIVLGIISIVKIIRKKYSERVASLVCIAIFSISQIYCTARLIKMYVKGKDPTTYWIWFAIGAATLIFAVIFYLIRRRQIKTRVVTNP